MKRELTQFAASVGALLALSLLASPSVAEQQVPSIAGTTWRTKEGGTWVFERGGALTENIQLVEQVAGKWSQDGRIVKFYSRHRGIRGAEGAWIEAHCKGTITGNRMIVKVDHRGSSGGTTEFQMVLVPVSKWPPTPPQQSLGPILPVTIFSRDLIDGWRNARRGWSDLYDDSRSDERVSGELKTRLAAAIEDFGSKIAQAERLSHQGRNLKIRQDIARRDRSMPILKELRLKIPAHNRKCGELRADVERLKIDVTEAMVPAIHPALNQKPSAWTIQAADGELLVIDSSGNKHQVAPGNSLMRGVIYESQGRLEMKRADTSEFDDELWTYAATSRVAPTSRFKFDVQDGTEYLNVLEGTIRQVVDLYGESAAGGSIRFNAARAARWLEDKLMARFLVRVRSPNGTAFVRGTDFIMEVESESRTIVSVYAGTVEFTFPQNPKGKQAPSRDDSIAGVIEDTYSKLFGRRMPGEISAGEQLVVERNELSYKDPRAWDVTKTKIGTDAIEEQWRDKFGEPLPTPGPSDKAISKYTEAIQLDPKDAIAYYNRGVVRLKKGDYDKAIGDYNEAIQLDPKDAMAYDARGYTWYKKFQYDKAIEDYSEAIRLDPKSVTYRSRGRAWERKGDYEKAISDYTEGIRLDPKNASSYNSIAWLLATCHDTSVRDGAAAVEYALKACELTGYRDANRLDTLAAAYAENRQFDKAVETQKKAIDLLTDGEKKDDYRWRLTLYQQRKPYPPQGKAVRFIPDSVQ